MASVRIRPAARRASAAARPRHRRVWIAIRAALLLVALGVLLVPPQSLRVGLATLLIVAVLALLAWRLPMADAS